MGASHPIVTHVPDTPVALEIDGLYLHFDGISPELRAKLDARLLVENGIRDETARSFDFSTIIGKTKVDPHALDDFHFYFASTVRNKHLLPREYKFFGNGNLAKTLKYFLRFNAFFTPALTVSHSAEGHRTFHIKTLDPDHTTWYSKVVTAYDPTFPRVNVVLDGTSLDIISYEVFVNGEDRTADLDEVHILRYLLVTLCYFSEVMHALIHIFDAIMATALLYATQHDDVQSLWAQQFSENTNVQYLDTKMLMFNPEDSETNRIGFRSNKVLLRPVAKNLLVQWLRFHTAEDVVRHFLFSGIEATASEEEMQDILDSNLFLSEWRKHAALLPSYVHDLKYVFTTRKAHSVETTDNNLKAYMHRVGDLVSTIDSLHTWVELMGAFALLHGNTLSMTRLLMTPSVFRHLGTAKESLEYTVRDAEILATLAHTISGLEPGRYFFSTSLLNNRIANPLMKCTSNKYDGLVSTMELEYYAKLMEHPEEFAEFGWIMSDYCPDGMDGKQITLNTYV